MQALAGIKILDMTRLLPGPFASVLLADFGAEVIKLEDPGLGDYCRDFEPKIRDASMWHLMLNRNKRSLTLDLKSPQGKELFFELVKQADVVMDSYRPGVLDKLGISYQAAQRVNPGIIYCSVTGYGQQGPYVYDAGHDLNYVSLAGITSMSGVKDGKPALPGVLSSDLSSGLYAALSIMIALRHRERTGAGQAIDISLHNVALSLLPTAASAYFGSGEVVQRGMAWYCGSQPNYNIYATEDRRYLAVANFEKKFWVNMCKCLERLDLCDAIDDPKLFESTYEKLQAIFLTKTSAQWMELFAGKDTCITPVLDFAEAMRDPHTLANEMVLEVEDEKYGRHQQPGFAMKLSLTPGQISRHAPTLGENSEEILRENGFTKEQIAKLRSLKII